MKNKKINAKHYDTFDGGVWISVVAGEMEGVISACPLTEAILVRLYYNSHG